MEIGKPEREVTYEPLEDPFRREEQPVEPEREPARETPVEVPA